MEDIVYSEFCNEARCVHYNLIARLEQSETSEDIQKQLDIAIAHCKLGCEKSAAEYHQWLKGRSKLP